MKRIVTVIFLLLHMLPGKSQQKIWVFFTDKDEVAFNPYTFFDAKAIERRVRNNIPLNDYSDIPVNQKYIDSIAFYCDSVSYSTRWFNALACYVNENNIPLIENISFVDHVEVMEEYCAQITRRISLSDFSIGQKNLLIAQTTRMEGDHFKAKNITGKGIRVAILDAGFIGFKECEALRHSVNREYVKGTFDFIKNDENVFRGHEHGTMVASCIAGKVDTVQLGLAPNVEFLLARTEKAFSDRLKEEERWLAAMEWADQKGADIINTSLGYTSTRYFRKDMNGRRGLISRAATMASRKGILVVCSAGNEGDGEWKIVAAPGDADSVLTVGAINPWTGIHASWSSYGPSSDKRIKPNVSAFGNTIVGTGEGYEEDAGTSFSTPLVAGFAACVMQLHPDMKNMEVLNEIEKSSDLYPYFDYAHGYGVPQAGYFTDSIQPEQDTTFDVSENDNKITITIRERNFTFAEPMQSYYFTAGRGKAQDEMEDRWAEHHLPDEQYSAASAYVYITMPGYVFYHVMNRDGFIEDYYVVSVHQREVLTFDRSRFTKGDTMHLYYKGYTYTIAF